MCMMIIKMNAIINNVKTISNYTKKGIMAVVKSDAYGLGASQIIKCLQKANVDFYVFNRYSEYQKVEKLVSKNRVLILESLSSTIIEKIPSNVRVSVNSLNDAYNLSKVKTPHYIHLQIDTGMNRLGIRTIEEAKTIIRLLKNNSSLVIEGIYTHYAQKDNIYQQNRFLPYIYLYEFSIIHATATSTLTQPLIGNYVRIGMALYGFVSELNLDQAVSVVTRLENLINIPARSAVGYEGKYLASNNEIIGVLPLGYYEGISEGHIYNKSEKLPIIGKICMNHTFVKLDNKINKGTLLKVFPKRDRIDNRENNVYRDLVALSHIYKIYLTEYSNDNSSLFKTTNKKSIKIRKGRISCQNIDSGIV